ncbi:UDP-N-acetylglucosamine 2-epimerase (non-hydrolyzing) [Sphingomonas sp. 1P06PA]|uniref:non-hydrolyzing UDP-N-acetylglucosamine 2-epimerase n=1 Tax=Sphingomonas sp. 1P06PA TaxID=554121 RepID=UPI0039A45B82
MVAVGTRPEAIKLAPLVSALRSARNGFDVHLWVSGQHREMAPAMLDVFGLPANSTTTLPHGLDPPALYAELLRSASETLNRIEPDLLIVQGDTATCAAAAQAAFLAKVSVGHVEAGLRTGNRRNPFPEEYFRRQVAIGADWHFAPTAAARVALEREGVSPAHILVTGNTGIDALVGICGRIDRGEIVTPPIMGGEPIILATLHRRESLGEGHRAIATALALLADRHAVRVILPVHPNPAVMAAIADVLGNHPRVSLIEPLDYPAFVAVMRQATLIVTDSGGIQEEAPTLKVPVLVARETTERPEATDAGTAILVGTSTARIVGEAERLLGDPAARAAMTARGNPFGDGRATARIMAGLTAIVAGDPLPLDWSPDHATSAAGRRA